MGCPSRVVLIKLASVASAASFFLPMACVNLDKPSALAMCAKTNTCNLSDAIPPSPDSAFPIPDARIHEPDLPHLSPDTKDASDSSSIHKDTAPDTMAGADSATDSLSVDSALPRDTRDTRLDWFVDTRPIAIDVLPDTMKDTSPDTIEGPCAQGGRPAPQGTVCRASTDLNACDPVEYCNGTSFDCPTDIRYLRPMAPTAVNASMTSPVQATLSWNGSANATGYSIKRSTISGSNYATLAWTAESPFVDTKRTSGDTYHYVLTAVNTIDSCESALSKEVSPVFTIEPTDPNLLGFWRFDETTSPYTDASGNGYHGTGVNSPTSGEGKIGAHSLKLNGTTQAVCFPTSMPSPTTQFSKVAWIKITDAASSTRQTIFAYHDDGIGLRFYISKNTLSFQQYNLGASGGFPANLSGQWTHVAGTFDGTTWRVYVNGNQVGTETGSTTAFPSGKVWCIGRKPSQDAYYFDGEIDEVRLYKRALTAAEIANLYQLDHL